MPGDGVLLFHFRYFKDDLAGIERDTNTKINDFLITVTKVSSEIQEVQLIPPVGSGGSRDN